MYLDKVTNRPSVPGRYVLFIRQKDSFIRRAVNGKIYYYFYFQWKLIEIGEKHFVRPELENVSLKIKIICISPTKNRKSKSCTVKHF